jgi:mannose-6-phosphate isomerase-like protein (cupin superfamily)
MSEGQGHAAEALLVRGADAEVLDGDPTSVLTLIADSDTTGGALTTNRSLLRQGSFGAPPHLHTRCTEMFVVLDGALEVLTGDEIVTLAAGDVLVVPPLLPHAFAPAPGHDADFLVVFTPGMDRFDYYRLLDRVATGAADVAEIAASQERFDNRYVESARWTDRPR